MNILVVNDDGYQSVGIKLLAEAFREYGNVYVVAPDSEKSGASSSISSHTGMMVYKRGNQTWSVEGTPSDCVKYGLFGLDIDADLVVSGVNNGPNIGIDTIYSGTIGETMEALFHGKKAIAFSADFDGYDIVKKEIKAVIDYIFSNELLSTDYLLNVNFPKKSYDESSAIQITDLYINQFLHGFEEREGKIFGTRKPLEEEYKQHSDLFAFHKGEISITPLKLGNGDENLTLQLKKKLNKNH
ncbi:5'/3'-nucleotidase SurE [Haloplasma contractile]|uniref:5'-nucleotidase SurE n=1 Tax=Haloplasma contractile SSD-17B TaxID=1033810 RepID=U2FLD7_9MOLU|nr:5'/3'-nucleotidase SurE [Haloplasma contractile]ERJ13555.1 5'-nucleotidase SurE protein [Haloplasma contractile SSD-17B]